MVIETIALVQSIFGGLADRAARLPWPVHDLLAYCAQVAAMMGGYNIVALLFLAGLIIGILASMAYVALKIT